MVCAYRMKASKKAIDGVPGLELGHHPLGRFGQLVDVRFVDGLDDVEPIGEVAVQGPDADAGLLGDRLHGRTGAVLGEDLSRRRDQPLAVSPGIGPQGALSVVALGFARPDMWLKTTCFVVISEISDECGLLNGGTLRILNGGSFRFHQISGGKVVVNAQRNP